MEPLLLDVRGLEPPEPLERALEALDALQPAQRMHMKIHRTPHMLYPILEREGYAHETHCTAQGDIEVLIWRMGP